MLQPGVIPASLPLVSLGAGYDKELLPGARPHTVRWLRLSAIETTLWSPLYRLRPKRCALMLIDEPCMNCARQGCTAGDTQYGAGGRPGSGWHCGTSGMPGTLQVHSQSGTKPRCLLSTCVLHFGLCERRTFVDSQSVAVSVANMTAAPSNSANSQHRHTTYHSPLSILHSCTRPLPLPWRHSL